MVRITMSKQRHADRLHRNPQRQVAARRRPNPTTESAEAGAAGTASCRAAAVMTVSMSKRRTSFATVLPIAEAKGHVDAFGAIALSGGASRQASTLISERP